MLHDAPAGVAKRPITGRTVFFCLLAFFGVVAGVNAIMIRAATSTFGGVETESSYKAGLLYRRETEAAHAQDALKWRVDGTLSRSNRDEAILDIKVRDKHGVAPPNLAIEARLAHPTDARLDHVVALTQRQPGLFSGKTELASGQWNLVIDILHDKTRVFRSKSRVLLR